MKQKFNELWTQIKGKKNPKLLFKELNNFYSEQHRFYHNLKHVKNMLIELEDVKKQIKDVNPVKLAIWYHDAIYNTQKHDNEEQSAVLAKNVCEENNFSKEFTSKVHNLIMATKHGEIPSDKDSKILIDLDLAILGKDSKIFQTYENNIRQEYVWVPKEIYKVERVKVLNQFLNRDSIYLTDHFKDKYENKAIKNLEWSINQLK